jgi:nicotinate-nucleotide pyrophosphorylase
MPTVTRRIVHIKAKNVRWTMTKNRKSGRIVAVCDALNLTLEADTEDELRSLIPEAIHVLMLDLFEDDELSKFLKDRGWQALNLPERHDGDIGFDVPWQLVAARGARRDSERRAH